MIRIEIDKHLQILYLLISYFSKCCCLLDTHIFIYILIFHHLLGSASTGSGIQVSQLAISSLISTPAVVAVPPFAPFVLAEASPAPPTLAGAPLRPLSPSEAAWVRGSGGAAWGASVVGRASSSASSELPSPSERLWTTHLGKK